VTAREQASLVVGEFSSLRDALMICGAMVVKNVAAACVFKVF